MNYWTAPGLKARPGQSIEDVVNIIKEIVSEVLAIDPKQLEKKTRTRNFVQGRMFCYYFIKQYTGITLVNIGQFFGGRDHTTIIHGMTTLEDYLHIKDPETLRNLKRIREKLSHTL